METAEEKYPELDEIAGKITRQTISMINTFTPLKIEGMPYARQCVLEMIIKKLESVV